MGVSRVDRAAPRAGMLQRRGQAAAGGRIAQLRELRRGALRHQAPAARARAGTQIDHMIGAPDGVLVVFDHHQRVALGAQPIQGIEQREVVARMQADGRFVQHVADALQIRTELRGQPNALRLAAGQGRRGAIQLQIAQAHVAQKCGARGELRQQIARDVALAAGQFQFRKVGGEFLHRQIRERGDRLAAKQHVQRDGIQPLACALRADLGGASAVFAPHRFLAALLRVELRQLQPGAEAALAPAVL